MNRVSKNGYETSVLLRAATVRERGLYLAPRESRGAIYLPNPANAPGFSLIEAVIATLLVGTVIVAAMNTVGASKTGQYMSLERSGGDFLANSLMAEIVNRYYEEPDDTPVFGRESGESGGQRDRWDDVDDYNGWSATPAERRDGTAITGSDWTRSVTVDWVNPNNLSQVVGANLGAKKITVTVKKGDRVIATLVAVRTSAR